IVTCADGGGIPVVRDREGNLVGLEAVIDQDRAAGLLAGQLGADAFLMLADVEAVLQGWGTDRQPAARRLDPRRISRQGFAAGSMRPKVEAAAECASEPGRLAGIGRLEDAAAILDGRAGTLFSLSA